MSNLPPKPQKSQFVETLVSVLPGAVARNLPPEQEILTRPERDIESERFFHRNFAQCAFPTNLYDRTGARQIDPFLPDDAADFPAMMLMPRNSASGCAFTVADGRLYFLYDRIERWSDAPGHLAFVAVQLGPEHLPGLDAPGLSTSEYLLLAHLLSGHSLKAAAAELGASYDTKRKQVQTVLEKFRADSQTALLRDLTLDLTAQLLDALLPTGQRRQETALVKRQYGSDVVVNTLSVGDGIDVPVWEFGDRRGRPILHFHNMLTPVLFRDDMAEVLRKQGLRWLVVPRQFLGPDAHVDTDLRMVQLTRALGETIDYLTDAPVICLGESAGVSWAVHFARHNPQMVDHLVLTATPQPIETRNAETTPTIYAEVSDRLRRDARVIAGLARVYNALARVPVLARRGLRHLYRASPPDLVTVENLFSNAHFFDWLRLIANAGTHSSMDEMRGLQRNWLGDLRTLDCAISFIHGAEDTISPADEVEALAGDLATAEFLRIDNAGHFVLNQHFPAFAAHAAALPRRAAGVG